MFVTTCIIVLISTYVFVKYYFIDVKNNIQDNYNNYSDTDDDIKNTEELEESEDVKVDPIELDEKNINHLIDKIKSINDLYDQQK